MRIESSVSMMHKLQKWWEELLYAFKITCRLMLLDVFRMHWESCVIRDLGECKSSYNALLFFLTLLWMSRAYCDLAMETRQFWLSGSQLGGDGMHDCITVPISLVAVGSAILVTVRVNSLQRGDILFHFLKFLWRPKEFKAKWCIS
jgi:hypothetical protein